MENISTTELRTKSSQLVESLKKGASVSLLHRSKIIGLIQPAETSHPYHSDKKEFEKFLKEIKPSSLLPCQQRRERYKQHLKDKYGQSFPRR